MTAEDLKEIISKIAHDAKVSFANYVDHKGTLAAVPLMTKDFDSDFNFWYGADARSYRAKEINNCDHIAINYTDTHHHYFVSMIGTTEIVCNEEEKKKHHLLTGRESYPKEVSSGTFALLKFSPSKIELWDSIGGRFLHFKKFGKTVVLHQDQEFKEAQFQALKV